jgi:hypothetical protein
MNEEAKKLVIEYLQKLMNGIEKGADFAADQIPQIAQEIIVYGRAINTATFVGCILGIIVAVAVCVKLFKLCIKKYDETPSPGYGFLMGVNFVWSSVIIGVLTYHLSYSIIPLFKSWFAPRLYLIEYIKELVSNG